MTHGLRAGRSEAAGPDDTGLAALGDQALLGLARAGNTAAFAELYDRHRAAARRLARRLVRGRSRPTTLWQRPSRVCCGRCDTAAAHWAWWSPTSPSPEASSPVVVLTVEGGTQQATGSAADAGSAGPLTADPAAGHPLPTGHTGDHGTGGGSQPGSPGTTTPAGTGTDGSSSSTPAAEPGAQQASGSGEPTGSGPGTQQAGGTDASATATSTTDLTAAGTSSTVTSLPAAGTLTSSQPAAGTPTEPTASVTPTPSPQVSGQSSPSRSQALAACRLHTRTMSRTDTTPTTSSSSSTIRCRNPPRVIASAASSSVQSGVAKTRSLVRCAEARSTSGSSPLPIAFRMSRSVRMPIPDVSGSTTAAAPTRRAAIILAAARSVWSGPIDRMVVLIASRTRMVPHLRFQQRSVCSPIFRASDPCHKEPGRANPHRVLVIVVVRKLCSPYRRSDHDEVSAVGSVDSPYWNEKTETLPREDLQRLQLAKLRYLAGWAADRSPHWTRAFAEAGFEPDHLRSHDDLRRIPFLTRQQWMDGQAAAPPYGELPVTSAVNAIRVHTTSGTTGRMPLRALDSRKDWAWTAEMWCYGMWAMGIRPADTAYVAFGYGSFIGFWGLHYALEKLGALTIPGGAQTTEARVRQIIDFGATVVASTPTYALRLAQEARALGLDLPGSAVHTLILSGEPAGSIPQTKALIESEWGAKAYDTAGMTEISTIFMFECSRQPGGAHIIEDHMIEEVIDPVTCEPVEYGERGERVVTSFGRSMIPLLRYRTADLVRKVPHDRCDCGRTFDLYEGGVLGRVDDMKLVRGTNVYARAIEAVVRGYPEVVEFQIRLHREDIRDEITLRVECAGVTDEAWPAMAERLGKELAAAHEGLRFNVDRAEAGSLPRFELKARRLVDERGGGR